MAQVMEFKLPDLGEGLTEAEIVRWLVEVGDVVAIDQPVVEVETAKAMVEVPCPYGGVVTARFGEEGAELPVGAPLLTVAVGAAEEAGSAETRGPAGTTVSGGARGGGSPGDASGTGAGPSGAAAGSAVDASADGSSRSSEVEASGNVLVGYGTGAPAARRRRVRYEPTAPAGARQGDRNSAVGSTGSTVGPTGSTVGSAMGSTGSATGSAGLTEDAVAGPVAVVSPLVRKLARQHDLDLRRLAGSGPDGLILRADVESAIRKVTGAGAGADAGAGVGIDNGSAARVRDDSVAAGRAADVAGERIPLRGVRGAVADKLTRSRREIPDATCWVDADATELMATRAAMNAAGGAKVSVLALLARICTAALARFPELNSTVDVDAREIVRLAEVHLGFAAQTERGLVVPVVRDAQDRNVESIGAEMARLTEAARAGKLTPASLTGGTFTLNNYGVFGVDGSTPILNHPEAAMLGVGRIVPKPWVFEGELAVRQVVQLSLTFDHRVCDGGAAGGFLRYVADCVERPAVLLRTL
ncbi:dihydrolipoamide acetyltransferase family protein [Streptomyces sp. DT24]|uniref:dihydrolipoamide acetyltransferase family protein n=1 Tax=Streptomyces sp. DT24 TaxID=3416520 RepID=UPI003CF8A343